MLNSKLASLIRDEMKIVYLFLFVFLMSIIGTIINHFEEYPFFYILLPILISMLFSTTLILKIGLKKLKQFKDMYKDDLDDKLNMIYLKKENNSLFLLFLMLIFIYFICLYQLGYFVLNIMGMYILFLGGGTFLIALMGYEMYIRILLTLYQLAQNEELCHNITKTKKLQQPFWFQYIFQLSKTLRNASLCIGIIFVFENALIYFSNYEMLVKKYVVQKDIDDWWKRLDAMPLEFWIIWIFVFISIGIAFPVMAFIQTQCIKKIVLHIQNLLKKEFYDFDFESTLKTFPCKLYTRLLIMQYINDTLEKNFFQQKVDRFVTIIASILTSIIHITSLYASFFTK